MWFTGREAVNSRRRLQGIGSRCLCDGRPGLSDTHVDTHNPTDAKTGYLASPSGRIRSIAS